jgi:hypothetical protein
MKQAIALALLIASSLAFATAPGTPHPEVKALQGFLSHSRDFDKVNKEVTRISNHRELMRQQWQKTIGETDLVKQVSASVWYACALLSHDARLDTACQGDMHYIDEHRARELLANALARIEQREKNFGSSLRKSTCRDLRGASLDDRTFCHWKPAVLKDLIKRIDSLPDQTARLAAARECVLNECTDGEFSVSHPDLPHRLLKAGIGMENNSAVRRSLPQAAEWYALAAERGHAGAAYLLAVMQASGYMGQMDMELAEAFAELAHANAMAADTDEKKAVAYGQARDYAGSRTTLGQVRDTFVTFERVRDYQRFVSARVGSNFLAQVGKLESLHKQGVLSPDDMHAVGLAIGAMRDATGHRLLDESLAWHVRAADRDHRASAQLAFRDYPARASLTPEEWRARYDFGERTAEKFLAWNLDARHAARTRANANHFHGQHALNTEATDKGREFFKRRLYWTDKAIALGDREQTLWLAQQLFNGPSPGYTELIRPDRERAALLAEKIAAVEKLDGHPVHDPVEDIILAVRHPERIPDVMEKRRLRDASLALQRKAHRDREAQQAREKMEREVKARVDRLNAEQREREEARLRNLPPPPAPLDWSGFGNYTPGPSVPSRTPASMGGGFFWEGGKLHRPDGRQVR